MILDLANGDYINSMKLGKGRLKWGLEGVGFVKLSTSGGKVGQLGNEVGREIIDYHPLGGCVGLNGGQFGDPCRDCRSRTSRSDLSARGITRLKCHTPTRQSHNSQRGM